MHDERFKKLLKEFFAEFFWLFFPEWAERFDANEKRTENGIGQRGAAAYRAFFRE